MGSGDWLKNIITSNKARKQKSDKMKESSLPEMKRFAYNPPSLEVQTRHPQPAGLLAQDIAAVRIQAAFRAFKARKHFCNMKRFLRLQMLMEGHYGRKQTSNTLKNLQSWNRIQAQIRSRRRTMVEDSGMKQKKLENQLKLDAKVRDLEVEWSGGSHTMVETLARMKHREEATVKRERAMAYAFSHQWRANSNTSLIPNDCEIASSNWGWSWMERWIAASPWDSRALVVSATMKASIRKTSSPTAKKTPRNRRLSYGSATKVEDAKRKPAK